MHGLVTLPYGDGEHSFRLTLAGIEELEEAFDRSIFELVDALAESRARSRWVSETLRVGLIGGGMTPMEALSKVRRYTDERPLPESRNVAYLVATAGMMRINGAEIAKDDQNKKPAVKKNSKRPKRQSASTLRRSAPAQP